MKTVNEWLEELPPYYRELALLRAKEDGKGQTTVSRLCDAIVLLTWREWKFWEKLYLHYYNPSVYLRPALKVQTIKQLRHAKDSAGMV